MVKMIVLITVFNYILIILHNVPIFKNSKCTKSFFLISQKLISKAKILDLWFTLINSSNWRNGLLKSNEWNYMNF